MPPHQQHLYIYLRIVVKVSKFFARQKLVNWNTDCVQTDEGGIFVTPAVSTEQGCLVA